MLKLVCIVSAVSCLLISCSQPKTDWLEGGIYATPAEEGGFGVLKVLKTDPQGVHVRLYSNLYAKCPDVVDEQTLYMAGMDRDPGERLGMGHLPISRASFDTWGAVFIQQSTVSEEELEGYQMWLEANGGYF